jgi:hypothetical protein
MCSHQSLCLLLLAHASRAAAECAQSPVFIGAFTSRDASRRGRARWALPVARGWTAPFARLRHCERPPHPADPPWSPRARRRRDAPRRCVRPAAGLRWRRPAAGRPRRPRHGVRRRGDRRRGGDGSGGGSPRRGLVGPRPSGRRPVPVAAPLPGRAPAAGHRPGRRPCAPSTDGGRGRGPGRGGRGGRGAAAGPHRGPAGTAGRPRALPARRGPPGTAGTGGHGPVRPAREPGAGRPPLRGAADELPRPRHRRAGTCAGVGRRAAGARHRNPGPGRAARPGHRCGAPPLAAAPVRAGARCLLHRPVRVGQVHDRAGTGRPAARDRPVAHRAGRRRRPPHAVRRAGLQPRGP